MVRRLLWLSNRKPTRAPGRSWWLGSRWSGYLLSRGFRDGARGTLVLLEPRPDGEADGRRGDPSESSLAFNPSKTDRNGGFWRTLTSGSAASPTRQGR